MIRRPPRSTQGRSSAASEVYKGQHLKRTFDIQDQWGKKLNYSKCNVLYNISGRGCKKIRAAIGPTIKIGKRKSIPTTNSVKYLGVMLQSDGKSTGEISYRISQATLASARLNRVMKLHRISRTTKLLFYTAMIRSVLLYATEVQVFTDASLRCLESFQARCLRRISVSPSHVHKISNFDIRESLNIPSITSYLMHKRLRWWQNLFDDKSALYGVLTAIFGTFDWDPQIPCKRTSPRIKLLVDDLKHLNTA